MPPATPTVDSRDILVPRGRTVPLLNGQSVEVTPWPLGILISVSRRLPEKLQAILSSKDSGAFAVELLPEASTEVVWLIAQTTGKPEDEVGKWPAEDVLDVALAIVEECVVPIAGKLLALVNRVLGLMEEDPIPSKIPASRASARSSSSSPTAIPLSSASDTPPSS